MPALGVPGGAVAQQFTQGNISVTGNNLDVAINGNGFFRIQQSDGKMAIRAPATSKLDDKDGNLQDQQPRQGHGLPWIPSPGPAPPALPQLNCPLSFPTGAHPRPRDDHRCGLFNLDARARRGNAASHATSHCRRRRAPTYGTSINAHDSQGVAVAVNLYFRKNGPTPGTSTTSSTTRATPPIGHARAQIQLTTTAPSSGPAATPATGFQMPVTSVTHPKT